MFNIQQMIIVIFALNVQTISFLYMIKSMPSRLKYTSRSSHKLGCLCITFAQYHDFNDDGSSSDRGYQNAGTIQKTVLSVVLQRQVYST